MNLILNFAHGCVEESHDRLGARRVDDGDSYNASSKECCADVYEMRRHEGYDGRPEEGGGDGGGTGLRREHVVVLLRLRREEI